MTTKDSPAPKFSLKGWSQRKHEAARIAERPSPTPRPVSVPAASDAAFAARSHAAAQEPAPVELPSVESLSFESDFTVFLRPQVDAGLQQQALKKLFSDPRFNVMDGLDIYIGDYTKEDPIAPELVRELVQGGGLFGSIEARVAPEESLAATQPQEDVLEAPGPEVHREMTVPATTAPPVESEGKTPEPGADGAARQ